MLRRPGVMLVVPIVLAMTNVVLAGGRLTPTELRNDRSNENRNDCGAKSLYLFCRALGMKVTEESVSGRCHIESRGMSLADVSSSAADLGVPLEGVFANSDELVNLPTPSIALLEPDGVAGSVGHFVVVLEVTDATVTFIDPRVRSMLHIPLTAFSRSTTGCYLIPSRRTRSSVIGALGIGCLVIGALWPIRRWRKRSSLVKALVILLCATGCDGSPKGAKTYVRQFVLKVDRAEHDLGTVGSEKKSVEFQFTNTGKSALSLDVSKSCGCLDAKLSPEGSLAPGQVTKLTVVIDPSLKSAGPFTEIVDVRPREIPEEHQLFIYGRVEGVWVKSNGFTVHLGDASLPAIEVEGFFDSKSPDAKFLEAAVELPGLEVDLKRLRNEHDSTPFGFQFHWSMPLVAKVDRKLLELGQYQARIKMSVGNAEKILRFPINVLP